MHEAAYAQAALPAPARVLGLNLKPYSLGHELLLIRENNPLSTVSGVVNTGDLIDALPAAAMFCHQNFTQNLAMNGDRFIGLKLWLWNKRLGRFNGLSELAKFIEYRRAGTLSLPDEAASSQPSRPPGAPFLLSLHQFIRRYTATDAEAWDYPYGHAQLRFAAWLESEGRMKVKNRFELEHDRSFAEWEKENPNSTLEVANA